MCNSYYGAAPIISSAHTDTFMAPYTSSNHSPSKAIMKLNGSTSICRALGKPPKFLNRRLRAVVFIWKPFLWIICSLLFFPLAVVALFQLFSIQGSSVLIAVVDTITIDHWTNKHD